MDLALRKTYRSQLTKLVNSVSDLLNTNQLEIKEIPVLIAKISSLELKLTELNRRVADTFEETQVEAECEKIFEYEQIAVEAKARLEQRAVSEARESTNTADNVPRSSQELMLEINAGNRQNTHIERTVRLPKIELIKFNGDKALWPAFWEQYSVAIHKNDNLDESTKYTYLKSVIIGRAATTIAGLTQSEVSYNDAINLLKNEYANTDSIINNYIQQLIAINPIKHEKDTNLLRNLFTKASTITRSLISLGVTANQYGLMVKSIIFNALPYNLRVAYNKEKIRGCNSFNENISVNGSTQNNNIDYDKEIQDLLHFLKIELDSVELAQIKEESDYRDKRICETRKQQTYTCTAAGLFTNARNYCFFCERNSHEAKDCRSSITISEKKDILRKNNCCFRCLKRNHNSKFCKTKISCSKCKRRHATTMCEPRITKTENNVQRTEKLSTTENKIISNAGSSTQKESATNLFTNGRIDDIYLQTAYAKIVRNGARDKILARVIIDGGSQLTFIKESLSRRIGLPIIGTYKISIMPFGSKNNTPAKLCNRVKLNLKSQYDNEIIEVSAVEVPEICFESLKTPSREDSIIQNFAAEHQLADKNITQLSTPDGIGLLIGADHYWKLVTGEIQRITEELTAVNTKLGWTLHGSGAASETYDFLVTTTLTAQITCEDNHLQRFWDLETIGIVANEKSVDNFTESFIENSIKLKQGRYEVSLPWKVDKLDSNYQSAVSRVKTLTSKLINKGKLNEYDKTIREYLRNDCAEVVPVEKNSDKTYYLPHHPVYRDDKETTKVRVVFDASAHAPGFPSLNDVLMSGDNLVPDLVRVLMNFRVGSIGVTADIEKAFLQISLSEEDRDSHRFLWYEEPIEDNILSTTNLPQLCEYRMKRVTFGVTTSPFILAVILKKHLSEQTDELKKTAKKLSNAFYVDDLVIAEDSFGNALQLYHESRKILKSANMNIRKWCTNDVNLMKHFRHDEKTVFPLNRRKVLGIVWHTYSDEISVDMKSILNESEKIPTKRNVLQKIARIFDPIGILAPYTISAKILLQRIWKEKFEWDQIISMDLQVEWNKWCKELAEADEIRVPRSLVASREEKVQLHIFADASPHAYGAVAYVKHRDTSRFLIAKNRVSPISQNGKSELTLPKLELTAALCAARLYHYIRQNSSLSIKRTVLWSDSRIALSWIRGRSTKWKPYVQNRVDEIRHFNPENWRYCPGKDNPADLVTRGITIKKLTEITFWFEGPSWLKEPPDRWPQDEENLMTHEDKLISRTLLVTSDTKQKREPLLCLDRFSSIERVYRITAYIRRFIHNARRPNDKTTNELNVYELYQAEMFWIRFIQETEFSEEITALSADNPISSKSAIISLNPFLDEDGILRLGGRLTEADLSYQTRHPIILPKKTTLTDRIIFSEHEKILHGGINATLAAIRKKHWILHARQRIKTVLGGCLRCRKLKSKPGNQPFAPVPANRLQTANPFKITGVDFAGPLYVVTGNGKEKVYIMLLTCAVIRAVHLELVPDLTTESCIRALRRFIARRGIPEVIYSDNAKTFHRTSQELETLFALLRSSPVQEISIKQRFAWKFMVERAAWWGGFWERMVKIVKDTLKITLGKTSVNFDELQTILTEVEACVNARPLTYIDNDADNLLILSPSHFLIGPAHSGLTIDMREPELTRQEVLKKWKTREKLSTKFWNRWSLDYLQQLRSYHHTVGTKVGNFTKGDVALLHDQAMPRLLWKLVRIINVFPGRDGKIRACEVQTSKGVHLKRPIQLLYPLELKSFRPGEDVEK